MSLTKIFLPLTLLATLLLLTISAPVNPVALQVDDAKIAQVYPLGDGGAAEQVTMRSVVGPEDDIGLDDLEDDDYEDEEDELDDIAE